MIKLNCLGAGRWGPNMVRAFDNLPDACIRMVCDLREQRLEMLQQRISGIEITTDADLAITDPQADAVVICTPVHTHYELTKKALLANKHVLVEKPLCPSLAECEELDALAEERGLVLAVGHVFLFNNGIRRIHDYISSGELGRVYYIHATRTNLGPIREDVNAAWDLASHDLSIFDYWLGTYPESVSARGECYLNGTIEDVAVASYSYPGGVMACVHAGWLNPRKVREITIVGEKKMAVWNDMDMLEPVRIYDKSVNTEGEPPFADSLGAFHATIRDGDVLIPKVAGGEPLRSECEHFIECIRNGIRPINNARMATNVVRSLLATDESMINMGAQTPIDQHVEASVQAVPTPV